LYLLEFPANAADAHALTEQCLGYVLEGRFASGSRGEPATVKRAGEGFLALPGRPNRFQNLDRHRARFLLAGAFRKGEPLFQAPQATMGVAPSTEFPSEVVPVPPNRPVTTITRSLLVKREIAELPGMESRIYLIEFPPAANAKLHLHPTPGVGYVLEGSFESAFGDQPATSKRAGEGFVDLPGTPHHFKNADATRPLRFVVAGTFRRDEPLFQVLEDDSSGAAGAR
jgi:quercetin dioxygenase-like cupin family protein